MKAKEAPEEPKPKPKATRARRKSETTDPLDGHAQRFFAEGEAMGEGDEHRLTLPSEVREADPGAIASVPPQRRSAFLRYVGIAVALCAVLCLAALARMAYANRSEQAPPVTSTVSPAPAVVGAASAAPAVVGGASAAAANAPLPVEPVASAAPPAAPAASASAVAAAEVPAEPASAPPEVPTKTALEEREAARRLLERNKLADAIEAALRSTSIDPTDADAWLLLGAAYQASGKSADARAAYGTCAKEAKKGSVRECQLMLR